jgi:cytochrome c oxidase subunit II
LSDGRTITADERYFRDSILLPRSEIVAGYGPIMPSFSGQIGEEDLMTLIAYLESLGRADSPQP